MTEFKPITDTYLLLLGLISFVILQQVENIQIFAHEVVLNTAFLAISEKKWFACYTYIITQK